MDASPPPPLHPYPGQVVGEHPCPTCATPVQHVHRPGRSRVYCTNACRQWAYRWRRAHGVRLCVERNGPAERSVNHRRHALRDPRDPAATLRDPRARLLTVCGVFAVPASAGSYTHTMFIPEHPWSCDSCIALVGAGPPGSGVPEHLRRYMPDLFRPARPHGATPGSAPR